MFATTRYTWKPFPRALCKGGQQVKKNILAVQLSNKKNVLSFHAGGRVKWQKHYGVLQFYITLTTQ